MLACNIKWSTVRLGIKRLDRSKYEISRGDRAVGKIQYVSGRRWPRSGWISRRAYHGKDGLTFSDHYGPYPSFVVAALHITRHDGLYLDSDGIQEYGLQRVRRVCVGGKWFTVITDPDGRYHPTIFEDHPDHMNEPGDRMQAVLRKALNAIDEHTRKTQ